jgi:HlyD family secretion protein
MTTRVTIQAQEVQDVLTIPLHSVFNDQGHSYCYVLNPQQEYEKRGVSLGISNDQWIEVKSGLNEGECVCLLNPLSK